MLRLHHEVDVVLEFVRGQTYVVGAPLAIMAKEHNTIMTLMTGVPPVKSNMDED